MRSADRGMSRDGGPEPAFRLACALEGAGVVVMDAATGLFGTKVQISAATGVNTTTLSSHILFMLFALNAIRR